MKRLSSMNEIESKRECGPHSTESHKNRYGKISNQTPPLDGTGRSTRYHEGVEATAVRPGIRRWTNFRNVWCFGAG